MITRSLVGLLPIAIALVPAEGAPTDARPTACRVDDDCGFDPASQACDADPRSNRQPPLTDQGIVCYCEESARRCRTLRVLPVPCEGDDACAIDPAPRPHPTAQSAAFPHERGRPCLDFTIRTTCERTNLCTMHPLPCAKTGRP